MDNHGLTFFYLSTSSVQKRSCKILLSILKYQAIRNTVDQCTVSVIVNLNRNKCCTNVKNIFFLNPFMVSWATKVSKFFQAFDEVTLK